jgi:hypothetical protein
MICHGQHRLTIAHGLQTRLVPRGRVLAAPPTTRYCPPGTERVDLAEQDLIPDSRGAALLERE